MNEAKRTLNDKLKKIRFFNDFRSFFRSFRNISKKLKNKYPKRGLLFSAGG